MHSSLASATWQKTGKLYFPQYHRYTFHSYVALSLTLPATILYLKDTHCSQYYTLRRYFKVHNIISTYGTSYSPSERPSQDHPPPRPPEVACGVAKLSLSSGSFGNFARNAHFLLYNYCSNQFKLTLRIYNRSCLIPKKIQNTCSIGSKKYKPSLSNVLAFAIYKGIWLHAKETKPTICLLQSPIDLKFCL